MAESCSHQDQSRSKVSSTAHLVAYVRGMEAEVHKEKKLFEDPYASILAGEVGERSLKIADEGDTWTPAQKKRFLNSISIRTRTIDDHVINCIEDHTVDQIVVLGAGLDTRPWRLNPTKCTKLEKIDYFEVDFAEIFDYKLKVLGSFGVSAHPLINYHPVVADLSIANTWPILLNEAGWDSTRRTLWVMEGFCNYLNEEELRALMRTITTMSLEGSHLIATMVTTIATHFHITLHRFWPEQALTFFQSCEVVSTSSECTTSSTSTTLSWLGREDDVEDLAVALDRATPIGEERRGYYIVRLILTSTPGAHP